MKFGSKKLNSNEIKVRSRDSEDSSDGNIPEELSEVANPSNQIDIKNG